MLRAGLYVYVRRVPDRMFVSGRNKLLTFYFIYSVVSERIRCSTGRFMDDGTGFSRG